MADQSQPETPGSETPPSAPPARLRFTHFAFTRTQAAQCSAEVALLTPDGKTHKGKASGQSTPLGDFRVAGEAALKALQSAVGTDIVLELQGVKPVRAFDSNVVIVSVFARIGDEPTARRLVGCHLSDDGDPIRSTVVAILGATNRLIGNRIATR
jgi:hypothetical protein